MKIIKAIKFHRELRINQEVLFDRVVKWSQLSNGLNCPYLNEYKSINKAVKNVEDKLPNLYFFLSDILGGASSIKNKSKKLINNK